MSEIRFYHLLHRSLDEALPALVAKGLAKGHKILIRAGSESEAQRLSDLLWTFKEDSFIPHGTIKDGHADRQPVFLTADDENPNGADMLILTSPAPGIDMNAYSLTCDIFDGKNEEAVESARTRWKSLSSAGHNLAYWQQNEAGGWDKKA